jgi:hypothetical protein
MGPENATVLQVVMLVFGLAATAIIQSLLTLLQMRGWHLRGGLKALLKQIDPQLPDRVAGDVAWAVVRHPLLRRSKLQLAGVVHREELVQLLLGLAGGQGPLNSVSRSQLAASLNRGGIADPTAALRDIRLAALHLEATRPDLAAHVREAAAVVSEAASEFIANLNVLFDAVMDRVSLAFGSRVRLLTAAVAVGLAILFQLDAIELVNHLAIDKDLRAKLLTSAQTFVAQHPDSATGAVSLSSEQGTALGQNVADLRFLASEHLITMPGEAYARPRTGLRGHLGIILSAILIGLGAPFWFNSLKTLLSLRANLVAEDQAEREQRAKQQGKLIPPASPPGSGEAVVG